MWKQLLFAAALVSSGSTTRALFIDGCPTGTFPVSVLDDPEVHCLSSAPCSGAYSANGLPQGVGACPSNTGCALLPNNEAIMGCVAAGRGDVAYVNADGSLTRGGKVINLKSTATTTTTSTTENSNNNANNNNSGTTTSTTTNTNKGSDSTTTTSSPTATVSPGNLDGADPLKSGGTTSAIGSQDTAASASKKTGSSAAGSSAGLRGSKSSSGSSDAISSPSPSPSPSPTPSPTPSATPSQSVEHVNSQQTLNDIDGDSKTSKGESTSSGGFAITSIIGIVVGCLAIVAVVAGVRLLKKDKEAVVETPEGTLDAYGGGITPKENVVLL